MMEPVEEKENGVVHFPAWWRLAVAFPVGAGTGLLPEPMLVLPVPLFNLPGNQILLSLAGLLC